MRGSRAGIGIAVFALVLARFATAAEGTGAAALDAAWAKAMKAGDVEGVVACYAPDAVLWNPFAPKAVGTLSIRDAYAGMLSANTVVDFSMSNTGYAESQDLSAGWGEFILTLQPKKQPDTKVVIRGRFTAVAKRINGRWLYVADHASADPEPAPAPSPTAKP